MKASTREVTTIRTTRQSVEISSYEIFEIVKDYISKNLKVEHEFIKLDIDDFNNLIVQIEEIEVSK